MTSPLARESRVFGRYLLGGRPGEPILRTYEDAVRLGAAGPYPEPGTFDRALARLARAHPAATRAADVYARHFCQAAPFRKRLILMLAILESHAPTYTVLDRVDRGGKAIIYVRMVGAALGSVALLVAAAVLLTPLRLLLAGRRAGGD